MVDSKCLQFTQHTLEYCEGRLLSQQIYFTNNFISRELKSAPQQDHSKINQQDFVSSLIRKTVKNGSATKCLITWNSLIDSELSCNPDFFDLPCKYLRLQVRINFKFITFKGVAATYILEKWLWKKTWTIGLRKKMKRGLESDDDKIIICLALLH